MYITTDGVGMAKIRSNDGTTVALHGDSEVSVEMTADEVFKLHKASIDCCVVVQAKVFSGVRAGIMNVRHYKSLDIRFVDMTQRHGRLYARLRFTLEVAWRFNEKAPSIVPLGAFKYRTRRGSGRDYYSYPAKEHNALLYYISGVVVPEIAHSSETAPH